MRLLVEELGSPGSAVLASDAASGSFADMLIYKMTAEAVARANASGLSRRELARRLKTSVPQLYRLLDTANPRLVDALGAPHVEDGGIRLEPIQAAVARAQSLVRRYVPDGIRIEMVPRVARGWSMSRSVRSARRRRRAPRHPVGHDPRHRPAARAVARTRARRTWNSTRLKK